MAQNVLSDENADMASCNLWPGFQQIARSRKKFSGPCDELFFFVYLFFFISVACRLVVCILSVASGKV